MGNKDYKSLINTTKWRKIRENKLSMNPLCELCEEEEKTILATEIHHVNPIQNGINYADMEDRAYDMNNLQSLCHEHHKNIHIGMKKISKKAIKDVNNKKTQFFMDRFFN